MAVTVSSIKNTYGTNVVDSKTLKKYQLSVLEQLREVLIQSFGPYGSNTCIKQINALNTYTKDGYTILSNVKFSGIIEESIRSDIETITKNIVETVGDGSTSATVLSYYLFKELLHTMETNPDVTPRQLDIIINKVVKEIKDGIYASRKLATSPQDMYDIAYVSSNGNEFVADMIKYLYKDCGMEVFIDVAMSTAKETSIKYYDGMTLNTGYSDTAFITNEKDNTSVVDKPNIYFFEDPIDTKEMGVLLDSILAQNIVYPIQQQKQELIRPTVIVAPTITRDMSSIIDRIIDMQAGVKANTRLPVCIISDTHQVGELMDIAKMCNAKPIRKYIDRAQYEEDVSNGLAPTPETIFDWAGTCESVVADNTKTKFINPYWLANENKTVYNNLLSFIKGNLENAERDGEDAATIGSWRRRLNSLKSNLVEIHVGGMTVADRDSLRHLVEDSVKNCRSAAANGIGWGSNFSGFAVINSLLKGRDEPTIENIVLSNIYDAYESLFIDLYKQSGMDDQEAISIVANNISKGSPFNIRTYKWDEKVKSSIESDMIVLDSVAKIISIMVTCNQFLTPNPQMNVYMDLVNVEEEHED